MCRLLVATANLPPYAGGAERVAWELAKRLVDKFEVHVLTTGQRQTTQMDRVTIHYIERYPLLTLAYSTVLRAAVNRVLEEVTPDLIHSHMALPWAYIFRKVCGARKVVTCHGSDVFPRKSCPKLYFLKRGFDTSDAVTVPSTWLRDFLHKAYSVDTCVIPNGVDTQFFRPSGTVEKRDNVVLFVGRFIKRKGISELMQAAELLPEYEFWFVGDPMPGHQIARLPNIKLMGFSNDADVVRCYQEATLCVFPSYWENFPLVGLEAMACGKAIIATKLGFSEYVTDSQDGLLIGPHDVQALVHSIRRVMQNTTLRRALEENAREKALQYDWKVIAEKYRELYLRL